MYRSPENTASMKHYRAAMRECIKLDDCYPVTPDVFEESEGPSIMGVVGEKDSYPTPLLNSIRSKMWALFKANDLKSAWKIHDSLPFAIEREVSDLRERVKSLELSQRDGREMSFTRPAAMMGARGGSRGGGGRGIHRGGGFRRGGFRGNPWGRVSVFYDGATYLTPCDFDPYGYDCLLFENERRDIMVGDGGSYYSRVQAAALFPRLVRR